MKVTGLTLWAAELALNQPYSFAGTTLSQMTTVILRLQTDTGLTGWGETCPLGATYAEAHAEGAIAAMKVLAPAVMGATAMPRALNAAMDAALDGHAYAKAMVDIAAWDLLGKSAGLPLSSLLGGPLSDPVPSYYAIAPSGTEAAVATATARASEGRVSILLCTKNTCPLRRSSFRMACPSTCLRKGVR